jgi:hypothetical protein
MRCPFCDHEESSDCQFCFNCGAEIGKLADNTIVSQTVSSFTPTKQGALNPDFVFPSGNRASDLEKVKSWNWGAFCLTWIWAFGNGLIQLGAILLFVTLFVPLSFLIVPFIMGSIGDEQAWKNGKCYRSVEEYKTIQKKWAVGGGIVFTIYFFIIIICIIQAYIH